MDIDATGIPDEDLDAVIKELEALSVPTPADYVPHPKQHSFHSAAHKIRFLSGGNRSGKTEAGVAEDVMHATGIYPDWFPAELRLKGPNRGRVVVTDYAKGGSVFEEKLWKWLPEELVLDKKRTQKGALERIIIRHKSGGASSIEILTHEQDGMVFEGWSGHWAHFDEPPPRDAFIATLRGLMDFKGRCWLTLTPISEPWLYDEFVARQETDVFFLVVDMWDNAKSRGGHMPDEELAAFEKRLTEDEKEARIHGRFRHLTGLVYKMFDASVHVIPQAKLKIGSDWPKYFVCDPHPRKPFFGIWAAVDPMGTIYVFDAIKLVGNIKSFSHAVLQHEAMHHKAFLRSMEVIRILDPNAGKTPNIVTGLTTQQEFATHGLYFLANVNDDIDQGHLAVAEKLSYDKGQPVSFTNSPRLFFVRETCAEVIRYIQLYTWDDWKGANKEGKGLKEKPREAFKDFCDCIRYLVMSRPMYFVEQSDPTPHATSLTTGYG